MALPLAHISRTSCTTRRVPVCNVLRSIIKHPNLQVLNGKFCREFSKIEEDLEKEGDANPINALYTKAEQSEMGQAEKGVRARLAGLL